MFTKGVNKCSKEFRLPSTFGYAGDESEDVMDKHLRSIGDYLLNYVVIKIMSDISLSLALRIWHRTRNLCVSIIMRILNGSYHCFMKRNVLIVSCLNLILHELCEGIYVKGCLLVNAGKLVAHFHPKVLMMFLALALGGAIKGID